MRDNKYGRVCRKLRFLIVHICHGMKAAEKKSYDSVRSESNVLGYFIKISLWNTITKKHSLQNSLRCGFGEVLQKSWQLNILPELLEGSDTKQTDWNLSYSHEGGESTSSGSGHLHPPCGRPAGTFPTSSQLRDKASILLPILPKGETEI